MKEAGSIGDLMRSLDVDGDGVISMWIVDVGWEMLLDVGLEMLLVSMDYFHC